MIPYWNNLWQDLPDEIREQLARQARSGDVPYAPECPESCPCWGARARMNFYSAHPGDCPCAVCGWAREQNAKLDTRRAVCGHQPGCGCAECLAQRARIAAGKEAAAKLIGEERARRAAAAIQAAGEPEDREQAAGATGITAPGNREKAFVPAEPPAPGPPDPAAEITAALREFDAWYAAGKGCLPEPGPLPAGICGTCRLSKAVANGQCFWCALADTVGQENLARSAETAAAGQDAFTVRIATGVLALTGCLIVVMMLVWMLAGVMP